MMVCQHRDRGSVYLIASPGSDRWCPALHCEEVVWRLGWEAAGWRPPTRNWWVGSLKLPTNWVASQCFDTVITRTFGPNSARSWKGAPGGVPSHPRQPFHEHISWALPQWLPFPNAGVNWLLRNVLTREILLPNHCKPTPFTMNLSATTWQWPIPIGLGGCKSILSNTCPYHLPSHNNSRGPGSLSNDENDITATPPICYRSAPRIQSCRVLKLHSKTGDKVHNITCYCCPSRCHPPVNLTYHHLL